LFNGYDRVQLVFGGVHKGSKSADFGFHGADGHGIKNVVTLLGCRHFRAKIFQKLNGPIPVVGPDSRFNGEQPGHQPLVDRGLAWRGKGRGGLGRWHQGIWVTFL
jgi:hypothetical protein